MSRGFRKRLLINVRNSAYEVNFFSRTIYSHRHHQSVLPKGRSFTASAATAAVLPKAGLPPQTLEPRLQFYHGLNNCGSFPLLSAPTLSLASDQSLKDLKRSQGHQRGGEGVDLTNCALWTSPKFTTRGHISVSSGFVTR